ncbi:MAG: enoyl-CoA hydratase-related protein [Planctomycetes bacterium]|nr:enoyl-CoA hydratase-related protein [Planctomycetota bacterium]
MTTVLVEKADRLATVTVNRPDKLNALNDAVMGDLERAFAGLAADPGVGAVIVTGAGPKAFVAGADIAELATMTGLSAVGVAARGQSLMQAVEGCGRPVIAAVNGYAFGGGLELALACHLRVFSRTAKVGLPEVGLGLIPGYGGTQRLPRVVGRGRALEMILTGEPVDAETALRFGLANRVVEPEAVLEEARRLAGAILGKGPVALRLALEAVLRGEEAGPGEGMKAERFLFGLAASSGDMKEGTGAFLERRKPAFRGL